MTEYTQITLKTNDKFIFQFNFFKSHTILILESN